MKVGVTATSHKVILNLLDKVREVSTVSGAGVKVAHRQDGSDEQDADVPVPLLRKNETAHCKLQDGEVNVLGGTAWLWSRPEFTQTVDVLFVDEAGQMSLANAVAVSSAAKSMVLLGDRLRPFDQFDAARGEWDPVLATRLDAHCGNSPDLRIEIDFVPPSA